MNRTPTAEQAALIASCRAFALQLRHSTVAKVLNQAADALAEKEPQLADGVVESLKTLRTICECSHQPFYVTILNEAIAALSATSAPDEDTTAIMVEIANG